jgi:hypothetical protein
MPAAATPAPGDDFAPADGGCAPGGCGPAAGDCGCDAADGAGGEIVWVCPAGLVTVTVLVVVLITMVL